jgi:hypothetical protein
MTNPTITRTSVESSCLASVGYAAGAGILEVEFRSGAVYRYLDVPPQDHAALLAAGSKGAHLNLFIKGRYREARLRARGEPQRVQLGEVGPRS